MIIGWSLINNSIKNEVFELSKNQIDKFKKEGLISQNARVGLALQWCVDELYQGKGLIQKIYTSFENLVKDKYDVIEASVRTSNPAGNAATLKLGMKTIFEDVERVYRIKETPTNFEYKLEPVSWTIDDKVVIIRKGQQGDENELYQLNKKWVKDNRGNTFSKGFLTSLYSADDFAKIISAEEIVIAEIQNQSSN